MLWNLLKNKFLPKIIKVFVFEWVHWETPKCFGLKYHFQWMSCLERRTKEYKAAFLLGGKAKTKMMDFLSSSNFKKLENKWKQLKRDGALTRFTTDGWHFVHHTHALLHNFPLILRATKSVLKCFLWIIVIRRKTPLRAWLNTVKFAGTISFQISEIH